MRYRIAVVAALAIIIPAFAVAQGSEDGLSRRIAAPAMSASLITPPPLLGMPSHVVEADPHPSALFTTLAATYIGVNALDVITTERALNNGRGREVNPAMAFVVGSPYTFVLTKAAITASTLIVMRRLHRKHPVAAIALLIGADLGLGVVVSHNARVAAR